MSILILGKDREDFYFEKAMAFLAQNFNDYEIVLAKQGQKLPDEVKKWRGDYLISYLCPWVIPAEVLESTKVANINFHPGPPEYPGSGCTNFALYNQEKVYGVTCHYMAPVVDSGKIIAVKRFPILESDSVYSITQRCYAFMLTLFYEVMTKIKLGQQLPETKEKWTRKAYQYKDFQELKRIDPNMDLDEIKRRVRAANYPGYEGAFIEIDGMRFVYKE